MKIEEIKGKQIAIKCVTKDEMLKVFNLLHNKVPWAYKGILCSINHYDCGNNIFVYINQDGQYCNMKGESLIPINKILASDFLKTNENL